jgi:hypothetical protein
MHKFYCCPSQQYVLDTCMYYIPVISICSQIEMFRLLRCPFLFPILATKRRIHYDRMNDQHEAHDVMKYSVELITPHRLELSNVSVTSLFGEHSAAAALPEPPDRILIPSHKDSCRCSNLYEEWTKRNVLQRPHFLQCAVVNMRDFCLKEKSYVLLTLHASSKVLRIDRPRDVSCLSKSFQRASHIITVEHRSSCHTADAFFKRHGCPSRSLRCTALGVVRILFLAVTRVCSHGHTRLTWLQIVVRVSIRCDYETCCMRCSSEKTRARRCNLRIIVYDMYLRSTTV